MCMYNICNSLNTGLSTLEAQIWGFYKHAQARPKKGVAYKKKSVYMVVALWASAPCSINSNWQKNIYFSFKKGKAENYFIHL